MRATITALLIVLASTSLACAGSFICQEPGGKRLVYIDGNNVSMASDSNKTLVFIDNHDLLTDPHAKAFLVVDDDDIRPSAAGVKIATFDGDDLRHGPSSDGKVLINYHHPDLCPTSSANRIYSIEGDALSKQQLVAGLYLLKPAMFKLSDEEIAAQQKAIKEAGEEADRLANADPMPGKWDILSSSGIAEKLGSGTFEVSAKKGSAYAITFDFTKAGGPAWAGAGVLVKATQDKFFYAAYGTPKTVALCVYEINGGSLSGTWYPWSIDGTEKSIGTETLKGPESLDGTFNIESAKAPYTGAAYTGTVTIKPAAIVGANDDAKPYTITWTFGATVIKGIGIRTGNQLFVASGSGADTCIAKFRLQNGGATGDWYKAGSTEQGMISALSPTPN